MKNFYKYSFLLLILLSLALTSCRKSIEKKIKGDWKRVIVEDMNSTIIEKWKFDDNGYLFLYRRAAPLNGWYTDVNDTCHYIINARLRRDYINIDYGPLDLKDYSGIWEIIFLRKTTMMIVKRPDYAGLFSAGHREVNTDRQGGIMFREFTKIN